MHSKCILSLGFLNFNPNRDFLTLRMIPQIMSMFFFLQRYTVLRHVHLFYCTGPICCVCVSSDGLAPSSQHRNLHSNCVMQQFYGLINFKGLYFLSLSVQTNSMVMHMLDSQNVFWPLIISSPHLFSCSSNEGSLQITWGQGCCREKDNRGLNQKYRIQ